MEHRIRFQRGMNVIAMDRLARELIDEDLFESWLICGVADGDIDKCTAWDDIDECYLSNENYNQLCELFKELFYAQFKRDIDKEGYYEPM